MKKNVFSIICRKIRNRFYLEKQWRRVYRKYTYRNAKKKRIMLLNTPEHGNLGDHALALAEYNMFAEIFPDFEIVEIPYYYIHNLSERRLKSIVGGDTIFVQAGGYLGTMWINEEKAVRKILSTFKDNRIVILPQTITYTDDEFGTREKNISRECYHQCSDLFIFVRDKKSLDDAIDFAGEKKVLYCPDMVVGYLYYDEKELYRENKCLLCMRKDHEKVTDESSINTLKEKIMSVLSNIRFEDIDTVVERFIGKEERKEALKIKLKEFASVKLVVTDRLHGMLFAAITSTPCIVLNNSNGKVKGVYEWIREVPYIRFVEHSGEFDEALSEVLSCKTEGYPFEEMKEKYAMMITSLKKYV